MLIDILSLFPEYFQGPFDVSILKRAKERGLVQIRLWNIRDFAHGKHKKVDDRPYGGGPGMVLMPGPVVEAIRTCRQPESHVIHLTPQGRVLDAASCQRLAGHAHLILVCGHYEGIDERAVALEVDEELSIGRYVLTNGCVPAIVLVDGVVRFLPGVLGHEEAAAQDSFQQGETLEGPQYTRPWEYEGLCVPEILRSGNHAEIAKWRKSQGEEKRSRL